MALADKLLTIQQKGVELQKTAINPHFKNKYVPLEEIIGAVVPLLNEHGIVLLQAVGHYEGTPVLVTTLLDSEGGERFESASPLILEKQTPQAVGSAITYMRRYALLSLLGLVADEDDDGNKASPQRRTRTVKPKATESAEEELGQTQGSDGTGGEYF